MYSRKWVISGEFAFQQVLTARRIIFIGDSSLIARHFSQYSFFLSSNIIVNFESSHIYDRFSFFFLQNSIEKLYRTIVDENIDRRSDKNIPIQLFPSEIKKKLPTLYSDTTPS